MENKQNQDTKTRGFQLVHPAGPNDKKDTNITNSDNESITNSDGKKVDKPLLIGIVVALIIIVGSLGYWFIGVDKNGGDETAQEDSAEEFANLSEEEIAALLGAGDMADDTTTTTNGAVAGVTTDDGDNSGYMATSVKVAVLADPDLFDYDNTVYGCDEVVMVEHKLIPTPRVLNAALTILFDYDDDYGFTPGNFIATQNNLDFIGARIDNGVAKVYLEGAVGPINGVCDTPRIETQITQTALQFPTVQAVEIYLNNSPLSVNY